MPATLRQLPITAVFNLKSNVFAPRGVLVGKNAILAFQGNVDKRLSMWIANDSTGTIYVSGDPNVSATAGAGNIGFPVWQQSALFMDDIDHEIWIIGTVAGQSVILVETFKPDDATRGIQLEAPPAAY